MFTDDRANFYLTYLAANKPPRTPSTIPMALGSYFDCRVKDQILLDVIGQPSLFSSEMMASVDINLRDEVTPHGERVWQLYKNVGAWKWLKKLLIQSTDIETEKMKSGKVRDLELRGIPDLIFKIDEQWVIFDWKVNGYFAQGNGQSPCKYYSKLLETAGKNKTHRDALITNPKLRLNTNHTLNESDTTWATQLATYAMLMGLEDSFIAMIDQLTFVNGSAGKELRCGQFRMRVKQGYMEQTYQRYKDMDDIIKSGWIFRNMDMKASKRRCDELESTGFALTNGDEKLVNYMQRHCR